MKKIQAKSFLVPIAFATIIISACKKNDLDTNNKIVSDTTVTASVAGLVTDLNNAPVSNATVTTGTSTTNTDGNGKFILANVKLGAENGFVKVIKDGFFEGSRTFLVNANTVNNVKIQLITKTLSGNFTSSSGGNVNITGGGLITFSAGIVNATSGAAYTGDVSVSTFYLNSSDPNFNQYMPGDLLGVNTDKQENNLHSFGMVSVELNDANGEKLQIAKGKTATIAIPIPSSLQTAAPATMPLWYFDDTKGIWQQEGSATRQNNTYVGTVAHFSFWTAGQLGQSVRLNATFKDSAGNALADKLVTIARADSTIHETTNGYTDNAGTVSALVPANETLVLKVFEQNLEVYSKSIGPFTSDTDLGVITIPNIPSLTLYGTVVDCNNNAVTTGSVNIFIDGTQWSADVTNGNFTITFNRYASLTQTATITAFNKTTLLWSPEKIITITSSNQNVGQLIVPCASPSSDSSYINLLLDGVHYSWGNPSDSLGAERIDSGSYYNTSVHGGTTGASAPNPLKYILLGINNDNASPGDYSSNLYVNVNNTTYNSGGIATTVTEYEAVGGYITGTASGQVGPETGGVPGGGPVQFSLTYKVKRNQ